MPRLELLRLWVWVEEEKENHSLKNVGKLFESDLLIKIRVLKRYFIIKFQNSSFGE